MGVYRRPGYPDRVSGHGRARVRAGGANRALPVFLGAVLAVVTACTGLAPPSRTSGTAHIAPPSIPASDSTPGDWPAYQGGSLDGVLPGHRLTSARKDWETAGLDGAVYAAPIVAGGLAIVATESDTVYAFDAVTGRPRWQRSLGRPMASGTLPCGNIRPESGISSTPVADPGTGRLYVVAFEQPGRHTLYVLDVRSGQVMDHHGVDPPRESPLSEQQRGALKLNQGTLLIPYGGLFGDCGQYHGWVVGVRLADGSQIAFKAPGCPNECAFWAPGGPTLGPDGDVWVASGNSNGSSSSFDGGNAVFRLTPGLQLRDWFAPGDFQRQSASDSDLGSMAPVLLPGRLAWIAGKAATGYLLRQDHLGHVGGAASAARTCTAFGAAVASGSTIFVPCWGPSSVVAIQVDGSRPSFGQVWTRSMERPGGLIVAYGLVWVIDGGAGILQALDPGTGRPVYSLTGGPAEHFATPAAAGGHVYGALGGRLVAVAVSS